jgi:hypothetical protein
MNNRYFGKIFYYVLTGVIIVITAGFFIFFYYGQSLAFAPPPASHLFLLIPPKPSVSKNLCSSAANTRLGATCHPASSFDSEPFPVNRGEELKIKIRYQPPTSIAEGDDYPELVRVNERISGGGFFSYQGTSISQDNIIDKYPNLNVGSLIESDADLEYKFKSDLRPKEDIELVIRLKAEKYTTDGPVGVDIGNSYLRYRDDGSNTDLELDEALADITDIVGPKGDIYSHGSVDNRGEVLGYELDEVDVVAAGDNVSGFNNSPDWQVNNYDLKTGDESYRDEKYYDYYLNQLNKRVELLIAERAKTITNPSQLTNNKSVVYYDSDLNINNSVNILDFSNNKTIIAKRNINIRNTNIENGNKGVVFISQNGNININNSSGGLKVIKAHFIALNGDINVNNQGSSHLIIRGSLTGDDFNLQGNNRVSYIYNTNGVSNLPGIANIYNPQPYEHY